MAVFAVSVSVFSEREVAYLTSQRLARIATVSAAAQPDVAPVGFEFDGHDFYGVDMTRTLKYQNVQGNPRVAFVIDDLETVDPWKPRGIKVHGYATIVERDGRFGRKPYIRITPEAHWSWGIEGPVFRDGTPVFRKVQHAR